MKPVLATRALAKLSPGGMSEFVQSVPVECCRLSHAVCSRPLNMIHKMT